MKWLWRIMFGRRLRREAWEIEIERYLHDPEFQPEWARAAMGGAYG